MRIGKNIQEDIDLAKLYGIDTTQEDIVVYVDSTSGQDISTSTRFLYQSDFTSHGDFQTIANVLTVLPSHLAHNVSIILRAGTHNVEDFLDMSRFSTGPGKEISIEGSLDRAVAGTYNVASAADGEHFVLNSDPGFSSDEYLGYFVRVSSGTGSGQIGIIRTHTGVNWELAAPWGTTLDASSVIEIIESTATLHATTTAYYAEIVFGNGPSCRIVFENINFTTNGWFGRAYFWNVSIRMTMCKILVFSIYFQQKSQVFLDNISMVDTSGNDCGLGLFEGSSLTEGYWLDHANVFLVTRGVFIYGGGPSTIGDISAYQYAHANLYNWCLDNINEDAFYIYGTVHISGNVKGSNVTQGGYYIKFGGRLVALKSDISTVTLTGTIGQIRLDGVVKTWADVDAETGDVLVGLGASIAALR